MCIWTNWKKMILEICGYYIYIQIVIVFDKQENIMMSFCENYEKKGKYKESNKDDTNQILARMINSGFDSSGSIGYPQMKLI